MKANYVIPALKLLELHPRAAVLANTSWGQVRGGGTYEEEEINDNGSYDFINY